MACKYYYDTGEEKIGPVTGNELVRLRATGEIDDNTWVRRAKSSTWRPLGGIDLRKEEEQEANPSLWSLLRRSLSWQNILLIIALAVVFIALAIGFIAVAWPFLLIILLFWLVSRASK